MNSAVAFFALVPSLLQLLQTIFCSLDRIWMVVPMSFMMADDGKAC
jgi:hypothetical protein